MSDISAYEQLEQDLANAVADETITRRRISRMETAVLDFFREIKYYPEGDDGEAVGNYVDWEKLPRYLTEIAGRLRRAEAAKDKEAKS